MVDFGRAKAKLFMTPVCMPEVSGSALPSRELKEFKCHGLQHPSARILEIELPRPMEMSISTVLVYTMKSSSTDVTLSLGPTKR